MTTLNEARKPPVLYFCGPSGSGKSTTLLKLAHTANENEFPVLFISLMNNNTVREPLSFDDPYSYSRDYFIFVDDAQNLRNHKDILRIIDRKGKAICLAFSPALYEERGFSTAI